MKDSYIYLDTYVLQQDMRVRFPKAVLSNLDVEKGKTEFDIDLDSSEKALIMKIHEDNGGKDGQICYRQDIILQTILPSLKKQ